MLPMMCSHPPRMNMGDDDGQEIGVASTTYCMPWPTGMDVPGGTSPRSSPRYHAELEDCVRPSAAGTCRKPSAAVSTTPRSNL